MATTITHLWSATLFNYPRGSRAHQHCMAQSEGVWMYLPCEIHQLNTPRDAADEPVIIPCRARREKGALLLPPAL